MTMKGFAVYKKQHLKVPSENNVVNFCCLFKSWIVSTLNYHHNLPLVCESFDINSAQLESVEINTLPCFWIH